ncbi:metastasis-suppressor KiSS-1 [Rhinichthys klamathensis goyatoka]|uniref:metastasis-suppressor KiSS-1 n=1 Tax=Rhinichthys klamathensis goyatoka TaxID=3034132 RepID=UPI0024B5F5F7|nr:metastasis-suppressor KiSS-1 [Rhinichthys klamathensis goyatoka]
MMLLTIILMMSVAIQDTYSSSVHFQYYLKDETPEGASLRVLRRTDPRPTAGSPSPKLSHFSMGADPQRRMWWVSPEKPYTKRRQHVAYYNLNSFGLRYGKREQNMLAGFKQKIHVK